MNKGKRGDKKMEGRRGVMDMREEGVDNGRKEGNKLTALTCTHIYIHVHLHT